jgi:thiol-disulfide isomerase/thioredoxin
MKHILWASFFILFACSKPEEGNLRAIDSDNFATVTSPKNEKAVLINLWATWCAPCIEEFPHLVKLQEKYKDQLDIVFISMDFPEEKEAVKAFLKKMNVDWPTYMNSLPEQEFIRLMPDDFYGAIPYTMIKDKHGNTVEQFMGKHSYDDFEQKIQAAIN